METSTSFNEFEKPAIRRRLLLPWWMRFFCWLFMILGISAVAILAAGPFINHGSISIYGFHTTETYSHTGLAIAALLIFKGFTAWSLWSEKDYAIVLGKIDGGLGLAACIANMFMVPFMQRGHINLRFEIIFLIVYLLKLNKLTRVW